MTRQSSAVSDHPEQFPPLPLDDELWLATVEALELSPQQTRIVELVLRGMADRQIAVAMGIGEPTIRTYLQRIFRRTETHSRMELAMRVLAVSHSVRDRSRCHQD